MAVIRIASTLALLTAAIGGYVALRRQRSVRRRLEAGVKSEPLQRWEGEGGSVTTVHRLAGQKAARTAAPAETNEAPEAFNSPH